MQLLAHKTKRAGRGRACLCGLASIPRSFLNEITKSKNKMGLAYCGFNTRYPLFNNVSGILRVEDVPGKVLGLLPSW